MESGRKEAEYKLSKEDGVQLGLLENHAIGLLP